jgi:hypothetical protein
MKKRYKEEQIVKILKEVESSGKLTEACRKYGVGDATIYNWRKRYVGLLVLLKCSPKPPVRSMRLQEGASR